MLSAVRITDTTLRDGSHSVSHRFTVKQVRAVVAALDGAGVEVIEVAHGDGLAGSTFNYGFSAVEELDLIRAAAQEATRAKIAVLLLPGVGTAADLRRAIDAGATIARIATHCTEADISIQHFGIARELGMETVGFLMLSHMSEPAALARQARIMVDAGAQCVYIVDSAGALLPDGVVARVRALTGEIGTDAWVGFHGHDNLGLAVGNSIAAQTAGARQIDGSMCGFGAGAGNTPTELLAVVFDRLGVDTGIDPAALLAAAEDVVIRHIGPGPRRERGAIMLGWAGVYSSFLLHAERASERYGVPTAEILAEVGRRGYVGGQEDMIIGIALALAEPGSVS